MKSFCVISGTRAESGLLFWLMKEIQDDSELQLQLIVTGMHLSPEFCCDFQSIHRSAAQYYLSAIPFRYLQRSRNRV
jgi:UDP-N-acetylglucosamine 2-epimerase